MTAGKDFVPRWVDIGPLTLDLFHRDARCGDEWLGLYPREFALFWRLAETPRMRLDRPTLLKDVWRIDHDPETNRLEVHVARLRAKLHLHRLAGLVVTDPAGGYRLEAEVTWPQAAAKPAADKGLDSYLRIPDDPAEQESGDSNNGISDQRTGVDHA
ncbi:winged helix-turn-helix domain-containing protein [Altererythrobacter sp.]|nr:winged helix-turn-helix domain-containing protein [Altererythrobacter sp.]